MDRSAKVFVAGHRGLVGSAMCRRLASAGYDRVVVRTRDELDLEDAAAVRRFYESERPDVVVDCAALVGGIAANMERPADFIGRNLAIQQSVVWGAHLAGVEELVFLASSCAYPRLAPQPMPETALLTGPLEPTNRPYAVAKIAGTEMCAALAGQYGRRYTAVFPPNVYGPGDNFHPERSHVAAAMLRRFHEALPDTPVVCWGTGTPKREFLYVDDLADAVVWLLERPGSRPAVLNVGTGVPVAVADLALACQRVVGHRGEIGWDTSRPDGFPEKTMDVSVLHAMGWRAQTALEDGLRKTYSWYKASLSD
jgi:GDP-L-fucose synthase